MTADEFADKFSDAHNKCKGNRCIFAPSCHGTRETCKLIEAALTLRAHDEEVLTLHTQIIALRSLIKTLNEYVSEIESVNRRYRRVISAYQKGERAKVKMPPKRSAKRRKPKLPDIPVEQRDGDERFAVRITPETPPKPKTEMVVI